jgi:hypothetical protein
MVRIVGMDEVGYGPLLGPFIVCSVTAEIPSLEIDLWDQLSPEEIPVGDSKKIFSQAKGISSLEPTALAWLGQLHPLEGLTHGRLWSLLSPDPRRQPWYGDIPLPSTGNSIPREHLRDLLRKNEVRIIDVRARILEPSEYNLQVGGNKSDLLFACTADLVRHAREKNDTPTTYHIGKQGGRRYYLPHIRRHLGEAGIIQESPEWSEYAWDRSRLCYIRDGEDRSFFIALASIIAKYLRETSMQLFNRYWADRVEGIRQTAGYGVDGKRFWKEIQPHLSDHDLSPADVLRNR